MKRRVIASMVGVAALAASVGAAPAVAETDTLLTYLTVGKLKPGKRISYQVVCSANCQLTLTSKLVVKGPKIPSLTDVGQFATGQVATVNLKPNKVLRNLIKANIGASKLKTKVSATNLTTGEVDTDTRVFKFK